MRKARIIHLTKPTPKPKPNITTFMILAFIVCFVMIVCNKPATAQGAKVKSDTIPAKRYQYFLKYTNVSADQYLYINRVKDSIINSYRDEMGGKTLRMYYDLENFLRDRIRMDSVEIREPKK
jgi:hypothetical protein